MPEGRTVDELYDEAQKIIAAANKSPDFQMVYTSFTANLPQLLIKVDERKALAQVLTSMDSTLRLGPNLRSLPKSCLLGIEPHRICHAFELHFPCCHRATAGNHSLAERSSQSHRHREQEPNPASCIARERARERLQAGITIGRRDYSALCSFS